MIRELSQLNETIKICNPIEQMEPGLIESLKLIKSERLRILDSLNFNIPKIDPAFDIINQLLMSASLAVQTPEISRLLKDITNNSMLEAVQGFSKCLQFPQIEAANLALIKLNPVMHE